jgi:hypothetical protein
MDSIFADKTNDENSLSRCPACGMRATVRQR